VEKTLIYIQQDATLHSLFFLETALHVSGCTTTHLQQLKQLYLQHLVFVTPLLLPDGDDGWWYHQKHVQRFPDTPPTAHSNQFQLFHDNGR